MYKEVLHACILKMKLVETNLPHSGRSSGDDGDFAGDILTENGTP